MEQAVKSCKTCKSTLPLSEFYFNRILDRPSTECKPCTRARSKKSSHAQFEESGTYYNESNKKRSYKWREKNPEQYANTWRKCQLMKKYGITLADYSKMVIEQNDSCALCGSKDKGRKIDYWTIDHCHTTGRVRGLLCHKCNTRLGAYEGLMRETGIEKVLKYLDNSRS